MTDVLAVVLLIILFSNHWLGRDDTDDPNGKASGMIVYSDHRTGCQYVGTVLGGITPRLDIDGKPICVEAKP
jgi:hypothetical protein